MKNFSLEFTSWTELAIDFVAPTGIEPVSKV